ncbi:alkaline phosphatase [Candidatus Gracilibacteria bacterium]|nr:alkaline phosphatase [Candidatus Gracilibacteria bacterium]
MRRRNIFGLLGAGVLTTLAISTVAATTAVPPLQARYQTGNVVFFHPDGTGANHWAAGRIYWDGPDALSRWDQMPHMALYRGHMMNQLTGTSNGGATVHAFGHKVDGRGSFGQDSDDEVVRSIRALSGFNGSIMREAAAAGHPVGVVNDGDVAEPGTGAFLAEVADRDESNTIALQMLNGRPGSNDSDPAVILGGGEAFFLPVGTPRCTSAITPDCVVHVDPVSGATASREDGRNLIREASADGWTVIRTRAEFDALWQRIQSDSSFAPKVLGLFAADDIFNDVPEERLISAGMVNPAIAASDKRSNLVLFGDRPGTLGFNPPTAAEMTTMALAILERRSQVAGRPFLLVTEVESTDNFGNQNNAIGTLTGLRHADQTIGAAQVFQARVPNTLILTAADSDAGGMQIVSPPGTDEVGNVSTVASNPTGDNAQRVNIPMDGHYGRGTHPFTAAPDALGNAMMFAVQWTGQPDTSGGIISRAQGRNAELLQTTFSGRFDSTDVYRMMYLTLFGRGLPDSVGRPAPNR